MRFIMIQETALYPHDPPQTLQGTPPRLIASLVLILMQFLVQRMAHTQVGQWYFKVSVLKETRSEATESRIGGASNRAIAKRAATNKIKGNERIPCNRRLESMPSIKIPGKKN
jgi:hypothetical protein